MSIITIKEDYSSYGAIRYFESDRCFNEDSVFTQLNLNEEYPDESHAYCEIIEVWRYVSR